MVERALTRMMETKSMNAPDSSVQHGSNNIFADLDLPDAGSHLLKAELVSRVDFGLGRLMIPDLHAPTDLPLEALQQV